MRFYQRNEWSKERLKVAKKYVLISAEVRTLLRIQIECDLSLTVYGIHSWEQRNSEECSHVMESDH